MIQALNQKGEKYSSEESKLQEMMLRAPGSRKTQKCMRKAVNNQKRHEEQKQQEAVEWAITDKKDIKNNKK